MLCTRQGKGHGLKVYFTTVREILWTAIAILAAVALFAAILLPAQFAGQVAGIFDELESAGFDIKIKTPVGEATFERVKDVQLVQTDRTVLDLRTALSTAQAEVALLETLRASGGGTRSGNLGSLFGTPGVGLPVEPSVVARAGPVPWVVVAGTGETLDSQRDVLEGLHRRGWPEAFIVDAGGWYQTVIPYEGRDAAGAALANVARAVDAGRDIYLRALDVLCAERAPVTGEADVFSCS